MIDPLVLAGVALLACGLGLLVRSLAADASSPLAAALRKRTRDLDDTLGFLRLKVRGRDIVRAQIAIACLAPAAAYLSGEALLLLATPAALFLPDLVLARRRAARVARIEEQLDGWVLSLANALKSTPSLGEGIGTSAETIGGPVGEELDLALKATRLGVPLDEAVLQVSERVQSVSVSGALAAVLVARQTGGALPPILERTAASLREMHRLEGVLRAKTSSARAQAVVLLSMPFVVLGALQALDAHWFDPLTETTMGLVITALAATLWLIAVLVARAVLSVDL